jgi:hypothetical protein
LQQQEGSSHRLQQSSTLREERDKEREKREGERERERERERDSHSLGLQQPLDLLPPVAAACSSGALEELIPI